MLGREDVLPVTPARFDPPARAAHREGVDLGSFVLGSEIADHFERVLGMYRCLVTKG